MLTRNRTAPTAINITVPTISIQLEPLNQFQQPTINPDKLMNLKTNLAVFSCVMFAVVLVIYLHFIQLQWKQLLMKVQLGSVKVALLTLPHFWILRSEEISKYVKRKLKDFYDSYFY